MDELREALVAVYGTDYGVHSPVGWCRAAKGLRREDHKINNKRVQRCRDVRGGCTGLVAETVDGSGRDR